MSASPLLVGLVGKPPTALEREFAELGVLSRHLPVGRAEGPADPSPWVPGVVVLTAQTPVTPAGGADTALLVDAAEAAGRHLRPGQLVLVTGPVPPGTTRHTVAPALARHGPGSGVAVAYTPDLPTGPRVVGGLDAPAAAAAVAAFARLGRGVRPVASTETAEACGTAAAVVRTVRAALATELHCAWERMGVDGREVVEAAGLSDLHPHRPADEAALLFAWGGRRYRASARVLDAAAEVNGGVAERLAERVADALNGIGRAVRDSRVVVVCPPGGEATEPATGVVRRLSARGAGVRIHDPATPLTADATAAAHGVLLLADPPPGWEADALPVAVVDAR